MTEMEYEIVYHCSWYNDQFKSKKGRLVKEIFSEAESVCYTIGDGNGFMKHRVDGPAVIDCFSGVVVFVVQDIAHFRTRSFCEAANMSKEERFMWILTYGEDLPHNIVGFYGDNWQNMRLEDF